MVRRSYQEVDSETIHFEYDPIEDLVSVLIVCYNDIELLQDLIPDVNKQTYENVEIICVLNNRDEASREFLSGFDVTILEPKRNLWYSGGNNLAAQAARGEFLFILNPDTRLESDTLKLLVDEATEHPNAGAFVPKILSAENNQKIDSIGKRFFKRRGWFGRRGVGQVDTGQYDQPTPVAGFDGEAVLLRRDMISDLGLFDDRFKQFEETNDLSLRCYRTGWEIRTVPDSVVYHKRGKSYTNVTQRSMTEAYYGNRNKFLSIAKHYHILYALPVLILHSLQSLFYAGKSLRNGHHGLALRQFHGLLAGLVMVARGWQTGMSLRDHLQLMRKFPPYN